MAGTERRHCCRPALQSSRWRESRGDAVSEVLAGRLDEIATKILARRHRKLRECGKRLKDGTPEERHRVRVVAKNARYATEFFQGLYPDGRAKRDVRRLTARAVRNWAAAPISHGISSWSHPQDVRELAGLV